MNKKLLSSLFFIAILSSVAVKGQPTITSANAYAIGDVLTLQPADTSVNEGSAGANQTWNFVSLADNGPITSQYIVDPTTTPYSADFPSAGVAIDVGSGNYAYYTSSSTDLTLLGIGSSSAVIAYSDPQTYFEFPFTYNSAFTDNILANYTLSGADVTRTGTVTSLADGYGTLMLPTSTTSNVLRIKYTQDITDLIDFGSFSTTIETASTTYIWLVPGNKNALLDISYTSATVSGNTTYGKSVFYYPGSTGTPDLSAPGIQAHLFPNPANDKVNLTINLNDAGHIRLSLYNVFGQEVKVYDESNANSGLYTRELDLTGLAEGIYFVQMSIKGENIFSQRLVKQ